MSGTQVFVHAWEDRGIGKAPFGVIGFIDVPSAEAFGSNTSGYNSAMAIAWSSAKAYGVRLGSCDVCGTGIHGHFVIQDAVGKRFVCGCDCVLKTDDSRLMDQTKAINRQRRREARAIQRQVQREHARELHLAELDRQRERNGGLTDSEVSAKAAETERSRVAAEMTSINSWLIDVLSGRSGDFVNSMLDELRFRPVRDLSDRCQAILRDIYAKSHGRSGSKKYDAAVEEFYRLTE